jgi:hypothetical protein
VTSSTSNSDTGKRTFATVLAALLPLWIIGGFFVMLDRVEFNDHQNVVRIWDKKIADNNPAVVVFGNSIAKRDINIELLAKELGLPKAKVQLLTVPDSGGALWYAALKNRVYAQNVIPKLVLVVSDLSSGLGVEPVTEEDHRNLVSQIGYDEPLLSKKVYQGQQFRWLKIRQHRGDLREYLLHQVRDYAVGALFAQNKTKLSLKGRAEAMPALERVFAAENITWDLHERVIPIVEEPDFLGLPNLPDAKDSFLPDLIKLAQDHGSAFVFARTPLSPGNTDDTHDPTKERDTVLLMNELKAGYLDMRSLDLRDRHYEDRVHMNPAGAALFTSAIAEAIIEIGGMEKTELPPAVVPVAVSTIRRDGEAPALPKVVSVNKAETPCHFVADLSEPIPLDLQNMNTAGYRATPPITLMADGKPLAPVDKLTTDNACSQQAILNASGLSFSPKRVKEAAPANLALKHAEAIPIVHEQKKTYWVYPGTTLTFEFEQPWGGDPDAFLISLISEAFSTGDGLPTIQYKTDAPKPIPVIGKRYKTELNPEAPTGAWSISIHSPSDGPYLALQGLTIGYGYGAALIIGSTADNRGAALRLIGGVHDQGVRPEYPEEPPPIFTPDTIKRGNRMSALFKVPAFAYISDKVTKNRTPFGNSCSPIRVAENGRMISSAHHTCVDVNARGRGRMCHQDDNIYFSASDPSYPGSNGRDYTLVLDPDRQCLRAWWLYPQDRLLVRPSTEDLGKFRDGLRRLEIDAIRFDNKSEEEPMIHAILRVNGEIRVDEEFNGSIFKQGTKHWLIDPMIPPGTTDIELELSNSSTGIFWFLTMASISEYETASQEKIRRRRALPKKLPNDLISISRTGDPQPLIEVGELQRTKSPCGYRFTTPYLHLSDTSLHELGVGRASPVLLRENGKALKPHATVREFQGRCAGAFGHTGRFIWFSPKGNVKDALKNEYQLTLHPAFPSPRANRAPVHWVYPGTQARVKFNRSWPKDLYGDFGFNLDIELIGDAAETSEVTVRLGEESWSVDTTNWGVYLQPEQLPEGPFEIVVESPENGAYAIIHHLTVGPRSRGLSVLGQPRNNP